MKEFLKKVQSFVFKYLPWIFITISLISFLIYTKYKIALFEKLGFTILSSGVFAAVLKSIQFTGIFKEEITNIISGNNFLKNRNDLPELWKDISKELYKRKFPDISDEIESIILDYYFPINHDYYYENYIVSINISEINDDFEIHYVQTCEYTVVLDNDSNQAELSIETQIDDNEEGKVINNLVLFEVNNKDITTLLSEDKSTIDHKSKSLFKHTLIGNDKEKTFNIKSVFSRVYSLKNENYKLFRMKHITKGMDVYIKYPENVSVSFFNIGLIKKFKKFNEDFPNQICRRHKNNIILPQQGFGMSFEKKVS